MIVGQWIVDWRGDFITVAITAAACGSVLVGFDGYGAYDGVLTEIGGACGF